jgi:TonB family protein
MSSADLNSLFRSRGGFDRVFFFALLISAVLHGGTLYAVNRWRGCVCQFGKVVCPKVCPQSQPRIDLTLAQEKQPPPPLPPTNPKPKPKPKAAVIVENPRTDRPPAAPKAGKVVLPDEAFQHSAEPQAEITVDRPGLPEDAVVKMSEAEAPVIVTGEIFGRADELTPGPEGVFGLGGTGTATGIGPFGTERDGGGTAAPAEPVPAPIQVPAPAPEPKGPTRPPEVLNWTDPPYPEQARQQGVEGTVVLRLMVGSEGHPRNVRVVRSSGHSGLDEAAVAHVKRAQFAPALEGGQPTAMNISFRVKFRLVNA